MRSRFGRKLVSAAFGVGIAAFGCGGSQAVDASMSASGLPVWNGHVTELFDDNIDPSAVGLSMEGPSPRSDPFLRERAQTSEVVARMRINTVTVDTVGEDVSYHLGVEVGVPPLAKPKIEDRTFDLLIKPTSRGYPIAKAFDARLRGMTFIGFVRRFASGDGELQVHFHLSSDTGDVANAVKEATALGELSGS